MKETGAPHHSRAKTLEMDDFNMYLVIYFALHHCLLRECVEQLRFGVQTIY